MLDKGMKEVVTCSQSASCGLTLAMAKRLQPFKTKFAACNKKFHKESDCVVIVKSLLLSMKVITTPPLGHGQSDEHPPHGHGRSDEHPPRGHGQSDERPHFNPPPSIYICVGVVIITNRCANIGKSAFNRPTPTPQII